MRVTGTALFVVGIVCLVAAGALWGQFVLPAAFMSHGRALPEFNLPRVLSVVGAICCVAGFWLRRKRPSDQAPPAV